MNKEEMKIFKKEFAETLALARTKEWRCERVDDYDYDKHPEFLEVRRCDVVCDHIGVNRAMKKFIENSEVLYYTDLIEWKDCLFEAGDIMDCIDFQREIYDSIPEVFNYTYIPLNIKVEQTKYLIYRVEFGIFDDMEKMALDLDYRAIVEYAKRFHSYIKEWCEEKGFKYKDLDITEQELDIWLPKEDKLKILSGKR